MMINAIGPLTVCGWLAVSGAFAQSGPAGPVDPMRLGPQVGDTVPDFTLPDQEGERHTLASLMGPNGLMLVFNRATSW
jgi:hypothetical protein